MRLLPSSILALCLCLASCGFKGPLYLSKDEKAKSAQQNDNNGHPVTPEASGGQ